MFFVEKIIHHLEPSPSSCLSKGHGGRIRPRREELHDAFHVGGDHRQVKLDLHLGQGPIPRPGEAVKILELGHLGLDPAALALIIPDPAVGPPASQRMAKTVSLENDGRADTRAIQKMVVAVRVIRLVRRHAPGVFLQHFMEFSALMDIGGGGLPLGEDARVRIQRQMRLVAHKSLPASSSSSPRVGIRRGLIVHPETVHPRLDMGRVHNRKAVRDEPPLAGERNDAVVNPGETLGPQPRAEAGQCRRVGRLLVRLQATEPFEGHLVAHLLDDAAVGDIVEELKQQNLEQHHRRGRGAPRLLRVAALAEAVDEAEVDYRIEAAQEVVRLDEAVIKRRVKKASLGRIAPEHGPISGGRGVPISIHPPDP